MGKVQGKTKIKAAKVLRINSAAERGNQVNYAELKNVDIANGPGVRVSLFVSGCTHKCKGCFNEVAWDFNYGSPFTEEVEDKVIEYLKPEHIEGFTFLGGEPMDPRNQPAILPLARRIKQELPGKTIWCYTGYDFEKDILPWMESSDVTRELVPLFDVMVDGPYVEAQRNISLTFRGSENQRIIDVPRSLKEKRAVWCEEYR